MEFFPIVIESDALNLVNAINNKVSHFSYVGLVILDCIYLVDEIP